MGIFLNYMGGIFYKEFLGGKKYVFIGWIFEIILVMGVKIYIVVFIEEDDDFVIIWKNYNGEILEVDSVVKYGVVLIYNGDIFIREVDDINIYVFDKWSLEIYVVDKE